MAQSGKTGSPAEVTDQLLQAMKQHVPFDGWTEPAFRRAIADSGVSPTVARGVCTRGAVDMAMAFNAECDRAMVQRIRGADLAEQRFRDRVAAALRFRLEVVEDRELVRRASTLFALPMHSADGARAVWNTADAIWDALGDSSDDINWYTKRATLSGVYSATVLYWLGDESEGHQATWTFIDRRIDGVMRFEKLKARVNENPIARRAMAGPNWALSFIKAPSRTSRGGTPGRWGKSNGPGAA